MDKKDQNKSWYESSTIKTLGAVGAIGASSALLHRSGLASKLHNTITRATRALSRASKLKSEAETRLKKETGRHFKKPRHLTWREIKESTGYLKEGWRETRGTISDLDSKQTNFLVTKIKQNDVKIKKAYTSIRSYENEVLIRPTVDYYHETAGKHVDDPNMTKRAIEYIHSLARNGLNNDNAIKIFEKRHGTISDAEVAMFTILKNKMMSSAQATTYTNWRIGKDTAMEKALDLNYNLDLIERNNNRKKNSLFSSLFNKINNTRYITNKDILDNQDKFSHFTVQVEDKDGNIFSQSLVEQIKELTNKYNKEDQERFLNQIATFDIMMDNKNNIFSVEGINTVMNSAGEVLAGTMPGKIFKMREFLNRKNAPSFFYSSQGSYDSVLAALTNNTEAGKGKNYLDNNIMYLHGDFFRVKDGNEPLELIEGLGDTHKLVGGHFGPVQNLLHTMSGEVRWRKADNALFRALDLNQDRQEYRGTIWGNFNAMRGKVKNPVKEAFGVGRKRFDPSPNINEEAKFNNLTEIYEDFKDAYYTLEETTHQLSDDIVSGLRQQYYDQTSTKGQKLFDLLSIADQDELMREVILLTKEDKSLKGSKLSVLANSYLTDPMAASKKFKQKTSLNGTEVNSSLVNMFFDNTYEKDIIKIKDEAQRELSGLLIEELNTSVYGNQGREKGYEAIHSMIDSLDVSDLNKENAKKVLHIEALNNLVGADKYIEQLNEANYQNVASTLNKFYSELETKIYNKTDGYAKTMKEDLVNMSNHMTNPTDYERTVKDMYADGQEFNEYITLAKSKGPLEVIRDLNEGNIAKAFSTASKMIDQLTAGRHDMSNVSDLTLAPYFMLHRLNEFGSSFPIGLSADSMGSTLDIMKGIMLKRVLPIGIGATYLEWSDDTLEAATGMSASGALAGGLAKTDIAIRGVMDTVGLTDVLKHQYEINPIMQYWGDGGEFMNQDELREYYEKGYAPVRKGAWWTFGSVNEARGAEIEYWQPTFARRIQSDYFDKSMYDGYFDKWSHSLLPTPINPLSPLLSVFDPYWLERKHEDDRPYPISGHFFQDGTPWGAILNPTVGEFIKPTKELHPYRLRNGIDIKANLYALNESIKRKADDLFSEHEFVIKNSSISAIDRYSILDGNTRSVLNMYNSSISSIGGSSLAINKPYYDSESGEIIYPDRTVQDDLMVGGHYSAPVRDANGNLALSPANTSTVSALGTNAIGATNELKYVKLDGKNLAVALNTFEASKENVIVTDKNGELALITNKKIDPKKVRSLNSSDKALLEYYLDDGPTSLTDEVKRDKALLGHYLDDDPTDLTNEANSDKALLGKNLKALDIIKNLNARNKKLAVFNVNTQQPAGDYIEMPDKLKNYKPSQGMELLGDAETVSELLNAGQGADLVKEGALSARLISGIYGYGLGELTGFGSNQEKKIATSQNMTTYTRTFWDSNIGGAGGGMMEIARRFIPDFKRGNYINPLMNEMPDWLPARYKFNDPFTLIDKGEMRLPGKGYESLNELHSDSYGRYGAFDRFKILADIAPYSAEYKLWRKIAEETVTDPTLIEEMDQIKARAQKQGKKHDFYNYKILNHDINYKEVIVTDILENGQFKSGDTVYKLAGARVKSAEGMSMQETLGKYIRVGQKVTIATDADMDTGTNRDSKGSINVAVYNGMAESVSMQMIENGDAVERKSDESSPAIYQKYGIIQRGIARGSEFLAHLDLPWISDQYLRVRSPLESYKAEQVYGTPYQTWSHPIDTFLIPAINRAIHDRSAFTGLTTMAFDYLSDKPMNGYNRRFTQLAYGLSNRGAFIGGALGAVIGLNRQKSGPYDMSFTEKSARLGSLLALTGHVLSGGNSYLDQAVTSAELGVAVAKFFEKSKKMGAAIGLLSGVAYRTIIGANGEWIPDDTKKKWEVQDYFDRLTYLKYQGLYEEAARRAKEEEDFDVKNYLETKEEEENKDREAKSYLKNMKKKLSKKDDSSIKDYFMDQINRRLKAMDEDSDIIHGGKWTEAAILYKQAADSTIEGLTKNSSWSQIVTALPTNDKEYFLEFVKERNRKKREEILEFASPSLKKALTIAWGMDMPTRESNEEFFEKHGLPDSNSTIWNPDVDLKDLQIKTIENEAMNLSDFGFYESQARKPSVQNAEPLPLYKQKDNSGKIKREMKRILEGYGLKDVDISVEPGPKGGFTQVITNFTTWATGREKQKQVDDELKRQLY